MSIGLIKENGLFYKLGDYSYFIQNDVYKKSLPDDIVLYKLLLNDILIEKIIFRKSQITIGFIQNNLLRLPLISKIFLDNINYPGSNNNLIICLCEINTYNYKILKVYSNLIDACLDLYKYKNEKINFSGKITNTDFYTKKQISDLTDLHTITIDPIGSRDFDDAISVNICEKKIYIHIVDIKYHLDNLDDLELEAEAFYYGCTLYTPCENVNIFNSKYAENLFSLIKSKDRHTITTEITLNDDFDLINYDIYRSIIKVSENYNYDDALELLNLTDKEKETATQINIKTHQILSFLSNLINNKNYTYSKINIPSLKIILDRQNDNIKEVSLKSMNTINKIIEILMIENNKIIAKHLENKETPNRFHDKSSITSVLKPDNLLNNLNILKTYKKAYYDLKLKGHFGLQLNNYVHFTSPIRRAFDIIIHQLLGGYDFNKKNLIELIEQINNRDILNKKINLFFNRYYILKYLKNKEVIITITKITKNGLRYLIEDLMYEDFIYFKKIVLNNKGLDIEKVKENDKLKVENLEIDLFNLEIIKYYF